MSEIERGRDRRAAEIDRRAAGEEQRKSASVRQAIRSELERDGEDDARESRPPDVPVVQLEHVSLAFNQPIIEDVDLIKFLGRGAGRVPALKGVNLSLAGGELTLLMGPSGSGKTTLLSVLGCMLTPDEGAIRLCGQSTAGPRPGDLANLQREHIG